MPSKHITPKQKSQIATLRAAGYSISAIAEKVGVSLSTVKRHATSIPKGAAKEKLIDEARKDLLSNLNDDTVKHKLAAQIADDLALSERLRERVATLLEQTEGMVATTPQEAGQIARALAATATTIKLSSDTLRQTLGVTQRQLHESDSENLPELRIVNMTEEEIAEIRSRAEKLSAGVSDGMGGTIDEENEIVTEGFSTPHDEPEAA